MSELKGKRAFVTGAARGIGASIALDLAERGADVVFTYERSATQAAELVRKIESKGRRALSIQADSANAEAVWQSVQSAVEFLGGLDILVNNAGVLYAGLLDEMPVEEIDKIIAVNIRSVVLASRAAIPHLSDGGRIVSIGSCLAERVDVAQVTVYAMSKSALLAFTRGLARELGPRQITVNIVHPGPTETDMSPLDAPAAAGMLASMALGHYAKVEDIAEAVSFLASPAARHITGTGLLVDGGMNA